MGKRNKNTFSKALGHLKSRKIDEKIQMLSERPANNTLGYMTAVGSQSNPNFVSTQRGQESALNVVRPDFSVGESPENYAESQDTTGLFQEDGTLRVASPPGDNSYILGPMAAMWYAWANSTRIGYIRQSDRRMVNLGGLTGKLSDWDGQQHPSGSGPFYSYGQMTLEQAQWFRTIQKQPGATNDPDTYNYRAFYPGPPSNTPDAFGRYYCVVTGEPVQGEELPGTGEKEVNPGEGGPQDPDSIFSAIMDRLKKGKTLSNAEKEFLKNYNNGKENNAISNLLDKMAKNWKNNTEGMGDKLKDNLKKVLEQGKNFIKDLFDANNAADFNAKLAINLGLSILSGKKIDIPLSDSAKKDLINNIDADALKDVLKINDSTATTADEAINPSGNKSDKVLGGGWDAQGGVDFNFNEKTGELEIVSNKTLRTDSGGESIVKDKRAPNFEVDKLTDIPDADKKSVQDMSTKIISDISKKLGGPGLDPNIPNYDIQQQLDDISQQYDDNAITSAITDFASDFISQTTQGTAQNILSLRNALKNLSIKSPTDSNAWKPFSGDSDIEKIGGAAGHVTSTTKVKLENLPNDIQKVITDKLNVKESYGRYLSESRKSEIIKNLKKPVVLPETKKKSYKVKPKYKTLNTVISKPVATPEEYKPPMKMWGRYEYNKNVRDSQEKLNHVMDLLGEGEQAMEYRLKNGTTKSQKQMEKFYGEHPYLYDFYFNNMNHKMLRKEQVEGGEFVVFLVAENGKKVSMSQSKLNEKLAEAEDQKLLDEYNKSNPKSKPISFEQDPLFKKVSKRLKSVTNYSKKPSPKGYPDKAPPKMVNGFHPDLGKRYKYDKLDPQSAEFMPNQGNPEIDANIEKFTDKNTKIRKIKNLLGKKG